MPNLLRICPNLIKTLIRNASSGKSGRTLVLKLRDESFDVKSLEGLEGLQESATTQNNAVFLTFDNKENALEALKTLKKEQQKNN